MVKTASPVRNMRETAEDERKYYRRHAAGDETLYAAIISLSAYRRSRGLVNQFNRDFFLDIFYL